MDKEQIVVLFIMLTFSVVLFIRSYRNKKQRRERKKNRLLSWNKWERGKWDESLELWSERERRSIGEDEE